MSHSDRPPHLVADIGGTNSRFALVDPGTRTPHSEASMPSGDFTDLAEAIDAYLQRLPDDARPRSACIAIAAPTYRDKVLDPGIYEARLQMTLIRLEDGVPIAMCRRKSIDVAIRFRVVMPGETRFQPQGIDTQRVR